MLTKGDDSQVFESEVVYSVIAMWHCLLQTAITLRLLHFGEIESRVSLD